MYFLFEYYPYVAIIGDIKGSKDIENRVEVQKNLNEILTKVNVQFKNDIESKFIVTLGDEFQGLLCNGANTMNIISEIERKIYPVQIRFGVGVGSITTEINKDMALGADGPAYHNARKAVEYLKRNEKRNKTNMKDIWIEVEGDNQGTTTILNTIFSLIAVIKSSWSNRQRAIIFDMLEYQESQMDIAKRLNIKQPAVQKSLAKGKYYVYKDAIDNIGKALGEIRKEYV